MALVARMQALGIDRAFWRDRRVFLTGHTGFIGGWLGLALVRMGARVTGFALEPATDPNLFQALRLERDLVSVIGDVRDADALADAMRDADPEVVFHLSAQPIVRAAHADPVGTFATNVMGTVNLLQAMRGCPSVGAAVVFTTDKVYENREWTWGYREIDALGGREPYGASKACAEHVVAAFAPSYFPDIGVATVRAGNVVGGGDWAPDRLVPDAARAFAAGKTLYIRHPGAVRPWQHVGEPVRGTLLLAQSLVAAPDAYAGAWNFGPDDTDGRTVGWVADRLAAMWGDGASWTREKRAGPYEANLLAITNAKAKAQLGWKPAWDVEESLDRTVTWYRAYYDGTDVRALSETQIDQALDLAAQPIDQAVA